MLVFTLQVGNSQSIIDMSNQSIPLSGRVWSRGNYHKFTDRISSTAISLFIQNTCASDRISDMAGSPGKYMEEKRGGSLI